jgi:hypothetical protein
MKSKKIAVTAKHGEFKDQRTIELLLTESKEVKDLSLLLVLLRESLEESIEIKLENFSLTFTMSDKNKSYCSLFDEMKKIARLSISKNNLGYLLFYLLKYYRDGIAESEHIDLDFQQENFLLTLTIKLHPFKELSADEVKQLLEL